MKKLLDLLLGRKPEAPSGASSMKPKLNEGFNINPPPAGNTRPKVPPSPPPPPPCRDVHPLLRVPVAPPPPPPVPAKRLEVGLTFYDAAGKPFTPEEVTELRREVQSLRDKLAHRSRALRQVLAYAANLKKDWPAVHLRYFTSEGYQDQHHNRPSKPKRKKP